MTAVGAGARKSPRLSSRLLMGLVHAYQHAFAWRPSPCRFVPSCSSYALEALEVHGAIRGTWLSVRRLLRCHPWGPHGSDPVPQWKAR
jgi:putative membrane protein insertion efficiency factor